MHIELLPQRAAVHLQPDPLYRRQQHLVLRRPGEHQMEQTALSCAVSLRAIARCSCSIIRFRLSISARVAIFAAKAAMLLSSSWRAGEFQTGRRRC